MSCTLNNLAAIENMGPCSQMSEQDRLIDQIKQVDYIQPAARKKLEALVKTGLVRSFSIFPRVTARGGMMEGRENMVVYFVDNIEFLNQ